MSSRTRRIALSSMLVAAATALAACGAATGLAPANPVGQWGRVADDANYLTILDDGTAGGRDGCNGFGGKWMLEDGVVEFADVYVTLVACPGGDQWLSRLDSALVVGDLLYVRDREGEVIGILPRVPQSWRD